MSAEQILELLSEGTLKTIKDKCKDEKLKCLIDNRINSMNPVSRKIELTKYLQGLNINQIRKGEILKLFPDLTELKDITLPKIIDTYRERNV
jgi:hypothetical protein